MSGALRRHYGRASRASALALVLAGLGGCHSAYVEATVRNASGSPLSPFEVDYPSASFGRPTLAPGAEYRYRFKVLGSGGTKVIWTDAAHTEHTVAGPALKEGDEGRLTVTVGAGSAQISFTPKPPA